MSDTSARFGTGCRGQISRSPRPERNKIKFIKKLQTVSFWKTEDGEGNLVCYIKAIPKIWSPAVLELNLMIMSPNQPRERDRQRAKVGRVCKEG